MIYKIISKTKNRFQYPLNGLKQLLADVLFLRCFWKHLLTENKPNDCFWMGMLFVTIMIDILRRNQCLSFSVKPWFLVGINYRYCPIFLYFKWIAQIWQCVNNMISNIKYWCNSIKNMIYHLKIVVCCLYFVIHIIHKSLHLIWNSVHGSSFSDIWIAKRRCDELGNAFVTLMFFAEVLFS